MAPIPYRIYLFFSALIPAFIYALIAAVLVGLLTLRVNENNVLSITLFFTALCFTACFRMTKDLWSTWPYAIYAKKFRVESQDIADKPTYKSYLEHPFRVSLGLSCFSSMIVFLTSYYLVPYAFIGHLSVLWVIGSLFFPFILFFILLVAADMFYRCYVSEDPVCQSLSIKAYIRKFYLFPEACCFLLLNFSIVNPLYSVQSASFDVAWVTMLATISITTLLMLISARSNPMNHVTGALNSKLVKINDLSEIEFQLSTTGIKDSYRVKKFSLVAWCAFIISIQISMATVLMKSYESWFYPFLYAAQIVWVLSYVYLRNSMLINTIKQVSQYQGRADLQQGYMDLSPSEVVRS